jgi:hypothetical protein
MFYIRLSKNLIFLKLECYTHFTTTVENIKTVEKSNPIIGVCVGVFSSKTCTYYLSLD